MCQKCVKRLKNLGGKTKVKTGTLKHLTCEFAKGYPVPLFCDKNSNLYIEARLHTNHKKATNKKIYNRKVENGKSHST